MMDEPEVDFVSRVGGAILLAETQWTPKAGVSKERAMALAAIEAMREPTPTMLERGRTAPLPAVLIDSSIGRENLRLRTEFVAMIDAALSPNQNGG